MSASAVASGWVSMQSWPPATDAVRQPGKRAASSACTCGSIVRSSVANTYAVGMSNLGFQTIYRHLNAIPDVVCERVFLPDPEDLDEVRDRGLLLFRLQRYGPALDALKTYLAARPTAPDHASIEQHVATLRHIVASLN